MQLSQCNSLKITLCPRHLRYPLHHILDFHKQLSLFLNLLLYSVGLFTSSIIQFYIQVDHILSSSFTDKETEVFSQTRQWQRLETGFLDLQHDSFPFYAGLLSFISFPPLSLVRVENLVKGRLCFVHKRKPMGLCSSQNRFIES